MLRAAQRAAGPGKSLWSGLGKAFTGSRTRTAAYVVHMGMVLVVAGLLGSTVYKSESAAMVSTKEGSNRAQLVTGDGRYTLVYKGMRSETGVQASERLYAAYDVLLADGTKIGTVEPHTDVYPTGSHAVRAVIMGGWDHDLFVVPDETFEQDSRTVPLRVVVFPLVRFVWLGSILLCVGATVSLWPKPRRQEQEARATSLDQEGVVPDSIA